MLLWQSSKTVRLGIETIYDNGVELYCEIPLVINCYNLLLKLILINTMLCKEMLNKKISLFIQIVIIKILIENNC